MTERTSGSIEMRNAILIIHPNIAFVVAYDGQHDIRTEAASGVVKSDILLSEHILLMRVEHLHQSATETAEPHVAIIGAVDCADVVIGGLTHFKTAGVDSHQTIGSCRPEGGVVSHTELAHFAAKLRSVTWP